jgi:hypothetical protein
MTEPSAFWKLNAIQQGPHFLKVACGEDIASAIVGSGGMNIRTLGMTTGCWLCLSPAGVYLPGSIHRVVLVGGQLEGVKTCLLEIIRLSATLESGKPVVRIMIPCSAANMLIGQTGIILQDLSQRTRCRIKISAPMDGFQERQMRISGKLQNIELASLKLLELVSGDVHHAKIMKLEYDKILPLGAWEGKSEGKRFDENANEEYEKEPLRLDQVETIPKKELVTYITLLDTQMASHAGSLGKMSNGHLKLIITELSGVGPTEESTSSDQGKGDEVAPLAVPGPANIPMPSFAAAV